ncbi:MAG: SPFH domain-containing protein, partial [Thermodesulfobacteriota bacterium]
MEDFNSQKGLGNVASTLGKAGLGRGILIAILIGIVVIGGSVGLLEINEAGYITVKQSILSGEVSIISKPGIFCQCFGRITKYKEAGTLTFKKLRNGPEGKGKAKLKKVVEATPEASDEIQVRFNDGGIGWISGVALFDLPKDKEKMRLLHNKFRSFDNLLDVVIMPTLKESAILTAALMDSGESYMSKRAIFTEWARDQLENGTYKTEETLREDKDLNTGDITGKRIVRIKTDDGRIMRNESPLKRYGIRLKQFQITSINYEPDTETIIKAKREAL